MRPAVTSEPRIEVTTTPEAVAATARLMADFATWAEDFLANSETYRLYTHTLHREGRLP